MKHFLFLILLSLSLPALSQSSFDELEFEDEELESSYKITGKNYVHLKSKRGEGGMNKTTEADALVSAQSKIKAIVLVYTETKEEDYDSREDANRERWENLLLTYPQFFQPGTVYKNICQCAMGGDAENLKKTQGFYVYVSGALPQSESQTPSTPNPPPVASTPETKSSAPISNKQPDTPKQETPTAPAKIEKAPEVAAPVKQEKKVEEPVTSNNQPAQVVSSKQQETDDFDDESEAKKEAPKKKSTSVAKIRKAKDPKACRPACYGYGDDDLISFFKDEMVLTKKEKKKSKKWMAQVSLQLNTDGSIKKATVQSTDELCKQHVESALKGMNKWHAAVKNGVTVKSQVRFSLKYDKATKAMRPGDFVMNPRPTPKCKCVSDDEIFGD